MWATFVVLRAIEGMVAIDIIFFAALTFDICIHKEGLEVVVYAAC